MLRSTRITISRYSMRSREMFISRNSTSSRNRTSSRRRRRNWTTRRNNRHRRRLSLFNRIIRTSIRRRRSIRSWMRLKRLSISTSNRRHIGWGNRKGHITTNTSNRRINSIIHRMISRRRRRRRRRRRIQFMIILRYIINI